MQGPKLQQLLKSSDYISQILDYLKQKLIQSPQSTDLNHDATDYLDKAIDLKLSLRFLVDGIETNRSLVQVQKQQIQKKKVFLEGLQYYKATLKNQISGSKIDLTSVKDYIQEEPSQSTDWIQDYKKEEQKVLTTLQEFKQRKIQLQQKQTKKQELIKQASSEQQKYKKTFPQQVKKLYSQVAETSKIFNIKELDTLAITEFKSRKIEQIHSLLYPLKLKQIIDLKHINQFDTEELEITIEKGFFGLYEFARQNKILIEEKQIRFYIANVAKQTSEYSKQEVIAVAISRREDFTTEQIFNNLLLQQKVKQIYPNPTTQAQRNTNTKYSQLNWIGQVLSSPSSLINGNQFIQKIKTRVFNLHLIRYALQNISKKVPPFFFPLFNANQQGIRLTNFPILDAKKILITKCQKTTFQEYRKQMYVPEWVLKAINNYEILKEQQRTNSGNSSNQSIDIVERQLLNTFIQSNNLQQLEIKDFYFYHRFELVFEKNILTGFILIPTNYPNRRSVIKLTHYKKFSEIDVHAGVEKSIVLGFENESVQTKSRGYSIQLKNIEVELNDKLDNLLYKGVKGSVSVEQVKKKQGFVLYFQINRLICIMIQKSLNGLQLVV